MVLSLYSISAKSMFIIDLNQNAIEYYNISYRIFFETIIYMLLAEIL